MLIMFACDIGLAPSQANTELGVRSGILGIIDGMAGMTQGDFNEDYAERVVEKVATARRLKGLEGEPAQPSMTQRKNAERKARQAMRRKRSGVCPEDGLCHYEETRFVPPECAPGDRSCADDNRRLEEAQGALREDLQRQLDAEYARLDAEAASAPIDNDTAPPPRYYGDAELAAALDRDLAAAWGGHSKPLRAPVRAPRSI